MHFNTLKVRRMHAGNACGQHFYVHLQIVRGKCVCFAAVVLKTCVGESTWGKTNPLSLKPYNSLTVALNECHGLIALSLTKYSTVDSHIFWDTTAIDRKKIFLYN